MKLWIFRYQIEYRVFVYRPLLGYRIGEKKIKWPYKHAHVQQNTSENIT